MDVHEVRHRATIPFMVVMHPLGWDESADRSPVIAHPTGIEPQSVSAGCSKGFQPAR